MTDRVTGRVTIADYMALHQVSESTVRRKIRAGELTAAKERTPHGLRWFIADQPDQARDQLSGGHVTSQTTGHVTGQLPGQAEDAERLIVTLEEQNRHLRQELERRATEIAQLHHVLARQANALAALPAMLTAPPPAEPPSPPPPLEVQPTPSPWWRRLLGI